jgi:hypothetical protein
MAIITKPVGGIFKGVPATITLNKSELSALASVSADSYFSVTANWNKIILSYKSSEGNQQEIVEFNATLSSPTGFFDVSLKARDFFEIQVIKIIDFDGDIFIIPRSELTTSDFDVEFEEQPPVVEGDAIVWQNTSSGYLIEEDGGVTTTIARLTGPFYDTVYGSSAGYVTGDFTYTAIISTSLQEGSLVGFYDSTTSPVYNTIVKGGTSTLGLYLTGNWNNGNPQYTIPKPQGETFEFKITRVGTLVKLFINGIEQASNNSTTISHLKIPFFTLRPNDYIISATVESEIIDEFWDVANKSGVGTVSVGANRLITKTSGGGSYDVNVLSLETITGDGYIEFPNSSLLNIGNSGVSVIGLAEQTSPNGGFQNIILGAFTVSNNWERVVNGSISGVISATNPNDIVRIGRIGTEYYIKINDVIKTQVTINNTNPLKASISLMTIGTGVDNITVESAEVPIETYVIWNNTSSGYLVEADGGATTTASRPSGPEYDIVYADSSQWVSGDFAIEWEVSQNASDSSFFAFYNSTTNNTVTTGFNGLSQIRFLQTVVGSYTKPAGDTFLLKVQRIGFSVKFYVNNVEVYSGTQTQENYEQIKVPFFTMRPDAYIVKTTIDLPEAPVTGDYVIWDLLNGPTTNEVGGLFTNAEAASTWTKLAKSSIGFDGDFTLTYVFDSADDNEIALGVSSNKTNLSSFSGAYAMLNRYNQGFFEYQNSPSSIRGNYPIPASGVQNLIVQRVGSQLTFTLNQTLLVTETVTGTLYPLGRPYLGNIISTYYDIT